MNIVDVKVGDYMISNREEKYYSGELIFKRGGIYRVASIKKNEMFVGCIIQMVIECEGYRSVGMEFNSQKQVLIDELYDFIEKSEGRTKKLQKILL